MTEYWLVKANGYGLNELVGNVPNGTGADNWVYQKRIKEGPGIRITEAVAKCSRRAISCVMAEPDITSVEQCKDPEKYKHWES